MYAKKVPEEGTLCPPTYAWCPSIYICRKEHSMLDVIMLAIGLGFFALSVGYTIVCDRL
jgi:hypothetical protein